MYSNSTGTSVDATLDTRLLTEDGRNQIKNDFYTASAITNAIEQIVSNDKVGITDFFKETGKNVKVYDAMKVKISNDEKLSEQLQDPNLNPIVKENMLKEVTLTVMKELGYVSNDVKLVYTDEVGVNNTQVKGYFDDKTNTSYVNDKYNNSTTQLIASLGHEITHDMDKQDNIYVSNDKDQNIYATNFGEDLAFYTNGALSIMTGGSLASTNTHNSGRVTSQASIFNTSNDMLMSNNALFASLDKSGGDDLTIFVHGTYSSPKDADKEFLDTLSKTYNEAVYQFDWSGKNGTENGAGADNSSFARLNAGFRLSEFVENYKFEEGETLNIIAHSHRGNVVKDFTQLYQGDKKIDNVTFMGTPVRTDYEIDYSKFGDNAVIRNVYDTSDMVQRLGGSDFQFNFGVNVDKIGIADRLMTNDKVEDIEVESGNHPVNSHSDLDDKKIWKQFND